MNEIEVERATATRDERLPYEAPDLVYCGDVSTLTQTGFLNVGTDAGYS